MLCVKVRVGPKGVIYLPSDVRRALGIVEGGELLVIVRDGEAVLRPLKSVFVMGIESRKISEVSVEEFERESEAMQVELYGS